MTVRNPVPNRTLGVLRTLRGWSQTRLAQASGLDPDVVSKYERGALKVPPETVRLLVATMGYPPYMIERAEAFAAQADAARDTFHGARPHDAEQARIDAVAGEISSSADGWVRSVLPRLLDEAEGLDARRRAAGLWTRLRPYPQAARLTLVREGAEFQQWALAELLCEESVNAAADSATAALELAELALRVAELARCERPSPEEIQGYAWGFLGNARRVRGEFDAADAAFARSAELWPAGEVAPPSHPCALDRGRLLGLEASLRREQRRFPEALALLDRALARNPAGMAAARLLLKRAKTVEALGDYPAAIAALRQASPWIDEASEPRLWLVLRQNLALNLCLTGRPLEAQALLAELRDRGEKLGNRLDLVRMRWLEGEVAAGLRRFDEAVTAFRQVRDRLAAQDLPFDAALVAVELAEVLAAEGRTDEVKKVARQSAAVLSRKGFPAEAAKALRLFHEAAEQERLSAELAHRLAAYLRRARHDPGLRFEAAA
jgi:tetratricopeptide (TPR) repeat protein